MPDDDTQDDLAGLSEAPPTESMDGLLRAMVQAPQLEPPPGEGTKIGRYVLISKLGAGAMGVVWAAYDPQLDRKVALKILRRDHRGRSDTSGRERAAREARALAKLIHPNIVAVHDGGIDRDALFVVMEFVDGVTLRAWLAETPRSRDEILDAFDQAAAGLVAAHDAKLIHRDFKPDNVLVGKDGGVRVADFGLARIASAAADDNQGPTPEGASAGSDGTAGTVTGGFVGTLPYMAPEQMERGVVDARADQFAFGVTLWNALYGQPPFEGKSVAARLASISAGPTSPPGDRGVPAWLHAIVRRALAARSDDRHPSMGALRAAIERGRGRRRRIASRVALVVGLGALAPILYLAVSRPSAASEACGGGAAEMATTWTDDRAAAIAATFPAHAAGQQAALQLRERLDGYAGDWTLGHRAACRATRVDRSQSEDMLDRRMACLARARIGLDAVVRFLGRPGADPEFADRTVDGLPKVAHCADLVAMARLVAVPQDPEARARIEAASTRLAELQAAIHDHTATDQVSQTEAALEQARQAGWPPLVAEATWTHAESLYMRDRIADSVPVYREALRASLEAGNDHLTATTMSDLGRTLVELGNLDEARWIELARAVAARAGNPLRVLVTIDGNAATIARHRGDFAEAVAQRQAAVNRLAASDDQGSLHTTELGNLASALGDAGRFEDALEVFGRVLPMEIARHGDSHPQIGRTLLDRGVSLANLGRLDEARADFERSLEIAIAWYGPEATQTALPRQDIGMVHLHQGDHEAARVAFQHSLAILTANDAPGPDRATIEDNLAVVEAAMEHHAEAFAHSERALAVYESLYGRDDPRLISTILRMGRAARSLGRSDESVAHFARAVALADAAGGAGAPSTTSMRVELAYTQMGRGHYHEAIVLCEGVLAEIAAGVEVEPVVGPNVRMCLAEALWGAGRDRPRARRLAAEARDAFTAMGADYVPVRDNTQKWLDEHKH